MIASAALTEPSRLAAGANRRLRGDPAFQLAFTNVWTAMPVLIF